MNAVARSLAGGLLAACLAAAAHAEMIAEPVAVLQGLDKITARVLDFEAPVGQRVRFGNLSIVVRACAKNPPEDDPENAAFVQIDNTRPGAGQRDEFSGWMFAESPGLSSLEDPIYDVILLACKAASGSSAPAAAPGNSGGNTAR